MRYLIEFHLYSSGIPFIPVDHSSVNCPSRLTGLHLGIFDDVTTSDVMTLYDTTNYDLHVDRHFVSCLLSIVNQECHLTQK